MVPNAANAHRVLQILEETPAERPRAPDVPPGLVLPRGAGTRVGARDAARCSRKRPTSRFMQCVESEYRRRPVIVTRSGYTGEVGFELFTFQDVAHALWGDLSEAMEPFGGMPVRARRSRRAAPRDGVSALRPGPVRVGHRARGRPLVGGLVRQGRLPWTRFAAAPARRGACRAGCVGLRMRERRHIPRAHYPVFLGDQLIGEVTSGTFSPLLQTGIGLAYLWPADVAAVGDSVEVDIRGRRGAADGGQASVRRSQPALIGTSTGCPTSRHRQIARRARRPRCDEVGRPTSRRTTCAR